MHDDLRSEYSQIGRERDAAGHVHDRQRFWFWVRVCAVAWIWVIIGGAIMAQSFRLNAVVGPFYFPDVMDRARLWMNSGIFVGTTGAFGTFRWAWRTASKRGYFD